MSCDLVTLSQALVLLAQLFGILSDNILNFGLIDNMFLSDNMLLFCPEVGFLTIYKRKTIFLNLFRQEESNGTKILLVI